MKNSQIHKGLKDNHIRDFLSLQLVKSYEEEFINNEIHSKPLPYNKDVFEVGIRQAEREIERLIKYVEINRSRQATIALIKKQGWEEFDVSDVTEKDLPYRLKMNFIGTEKEFVEKFEPNYKNKLS